MRLAPVAEDLAERLGLSLNLGPWPLAGVGYGLPSAHALLVAARVGLLAELAGAAAPGGRGTAALAERLALAPEPLGALLDVLVADRLVARRADGEHALARRARRWLDPASPTSVVAYLEHAAEYPDWWRELEGLVRTGRHVELHERGAEDPSWAAYLAGQHALARLSAPAVARAVAVPRGARAALDLAGGHGLHAAALCARHPGLRATVLDLAPSAAAGERIARREGYADPLRFAAGDLRRGALGGPYDVALCFGLSHHLADDALAELLAALRGALRPGGTLAVLDLFAPAPGRRPRGSAAGLGLFFALTSGAGLRSVPALQAALRAAGLAPGRVRRVRSLPDQRLVQAQAA